MCTIDWGATPSVCRSPAAADIQPSPRPVTWCTVLYCTILYCSGECGGEDGGKKGQGGVGLAVRTSITRAARPPEFIGDRLLTVTLEHEPRGRAKAVTFFVAYAPTETQNAST